ncbi:MAG: hypothetical protein ACKVVT_02875 [Dehalococcoidia bacterium]
MTTRESAHALLDALPESALEDALAALDRIAGRIFSDEDEVLSPEELSAIARGREQIKAGRWHSDEAVDAMLARFEPASRP